MSKLLLASVDEQVGSNYLVPTQVDQNSESKIIEYFGSDLMSEARKYSDRY